MTRTGFLPQGRFDMTNNSWKSCNSMIHKTSPGLEKLN